MTRLIVIFLAANPSNMRKIFLYCIELVRNQKGVTWSTGIWNLGDIPPDGDCFSKPNDYAKTVNDDPRKFSALFASSINDATLFKSFSDETRPMRWLLAIDMLENKKKWKNDLNFDYNQLDLDQHDLDERRSESIKKYYHFVLENSALLTGKPMATKIALLENLFSTRIALFNNSFLDQEIPLRGAEEEKTVSEMIENGKVITFHRDNRTMIKNRGKPTERKIGPQICIKVDGKRLNSILKKVAKQFKTQQDVQNNNTPSLNTL